MLEIFLRSSCYKTIDYAIRENVLDEKLSRPVIPNRNKVLIFSLVTTKRVWFKVYITNLYLCNNTIKNLFCVLIMVLGKIVLKDREAIISNQMKTYNIFGWYKKVLLVDRVSRKLISKLLIDTDSYIN